MRRLQHQPTVLLLLIALCSLRHCILVESSIAPALVTLLVPRGGSASSSNKGNHNSNHNNNSNTNGGEHHHPSAKLPPKKKRKSASSDKKPKKATASPIVEEIIKEEDYYKILGITKEAIQTSKHADRDITKAYRKRAVHTHPDKTGGDRRAFDKVAEAYEVLQDKDKRAAYDRFGKEGMKQQSSPHNFGGTTAGGMSAEDLFRSFFGSAGFGSSGSSNYSGFGGRQQQQQPRRVRQYILDLSLEDLYMGTTKTVQLPDGETIQCKIPRGLRDGTALSVETSSGESVLLIVRPRQHHLFIKQGFDLILTLRITLTEAITGATRRIRLLDGSSILVASASEDDGGPAVIETGDVQVLKGYGMPKGEAEGSSLSSFEKGNLYIQYEVSTKRKRGSSGSSSSRSPLSQEEMAQLKALLSKLEGRLNDADSKSNVWPINNNKDQKKVKRLQKATPEDIQPQEQSGRNPFEGTGFSFGAGFSPFGGGGSFFSSGRF